MKLANPLKFRRRKAPVNVSPRQKFKRLLVAAGIFLVLVMVGFYALMSILFANALLKSPERYDSKYTPADYGLKYNDVSFPAAFDNLAIKGWFVPATTQSDKVVVVLHGKGQNRGSYLDIGDTLAEHGFNVLLFDFRGHGQTAGTNYTYGYYEQRDVAGAVTYLEKQLGYQGQHIGFLGYSLGAVAGILTFSQTDIKAMISDSAFADLAPRLDLALGDYLKSPLRQLLLPGIELSATLISGLDVNGVRPIEAVKNLNGRHLLLIHGEDDETAPYTDSVELKDAAGDNAELWLVPGAGHALAITTVPQEYNQRVLTFFNRELA